jgi:hypothetical protein
VGLDRPSFKNVTKSHPKQVDVPDAHGIVTATDRINDNGEIVGLFGTDVAGPFKGYTRVGRTYTTVMFPGSTETRVRGLVQRLPESGHYPAHPRMDERSRTGKRQEHNFIDPTAPAGASPLTEATPCKQTGLVVIGPEVGSARVGNVDGDEWDVCFQILRSDRGSHGLIGLELDDQIHSLMNQVLGISEGHLRLISIVDNDELDIFGLRGGLKTRINLMRE